jgi:heterotetrameric sarcosine oxidase gamma subunit
VSNAPHRASPFSRRWGGEQVLAPALAGGITLRALAERAVYRLEVGDRTAFEAAFRRLFGWPPPAINRSGGTVELRCLGVAPAAWLFTGPDDGNRRLWQSCRDLADAADGALVDLSHGYCVLSLEGGAARGLLAQLCPADVHFAAFSADYCLSSNLEGHRVLIDVPDERPALELFVERSYSLSFWECLVDAAETYAEAGP